MSLAAQKVNNRTGRIPTTLLGLQKRFFVLRPIHNKGDYQDAFAVAEELSAHGDLNSEQADYLEVLTKVIADYEEKHLEMSKGQKGTFCFSCWRLIEGWANSAECRTVRDFELFSVEFGVGAKPGKFQFVFIIINSNPPAAHLRCRK